MRTVRMTRAEKRAARLPALLTVPMIVFILPTLSIVLLARRRSASSTPSRTADPPPLTAGRHFRCNSGARQLRGISRWTDWNQKLARPLSACEGPEQAFFRHSGANGTKKPSYPDFV
jgi:hypothetical protein